MREVYRRDFELILAWRSNPKVYQYFYDQTGPLNWEEHFHFWTHRGNRKDWIIQYKNEDEKQQELRRIGCLYVVNLDTDYPEIGLFIGEVTLWGQGLGKQILERGLKWLKEKKYLGVKALIASSNDRSINLFSNRGFSKVPEQKNDESWNLYKLVFDQS